MQLLDPDHMAPPAQDALFSPLTRLHHWPHVTSLALPFPQGPGQPPTPAETASYSLMLMLSSSTGVEV